MHAKTLFMAEVWHSLPHSATDKNRPETDKNRPHPALRPHPRYCGVKFWGCQVLAADPLFSRWNDGAVFRIDFSNCHSG
jgi:hypothetical protein